MDRINSESFEEKLDLCWSEPRKCYVEDCGCDGWESGRREIPEHELIGIMVSELIDHKIETYCLDFYAYKSGETYAIETTTSVKEISNESDKSLYKALKKAVEDISW